MTYKTYHFYAEVQRPSGNTERVEGFWTTSVDISDLGEQDRLRTNIGAAFTPPTAKPFILSLTVVG